MMRLDTYQIVINFVILRVDLTENFKYSLTFLICFTHTFNYKVGLTLIYFGYYNLTNLMYLIRVHTERVLEKSTLLV